MANGSDHSAGGGSGAASAAGGGAAAGSANAIAARRVPAAVQTFTIDHFVHGIVTWDIFGEIYAEAKGERYFDFACLSDVVRGCTGLLMCLYVVYVCSGFVFICLSVYVCFVYIM